jgi:hypothetical protein
MDPITLGLGLFAGYQWATRTSAPAAPAASSPNAGQAPAPNEPPPPPPMTPEQIALICDRTAHGVKVFNPNAAAAVWRTLRARACEPISEPGSAAFVARLARRVGTDGTSTAAELVRNALEGGRVVVFVTLNAILPPESAAPGDRLVVIADRAAVADLPMLVSPFLAVLEAEPVAPATTSAPAAKPGTRRRGRAEGPGLVATLPKPEEPARLNGAPAPATNGTIAEREAEPARTE